MKEYEVSIVTPFHNVDIDIFKTGLESMKAQTYGFDKIEWIIVIHNSGEEYVKALHEMCDMYDNIVLAVLNNKIYTPSSPRNHGLKLAHGRYIGFLDGDDSLTPNCVKDVLYHMKKTCAQITWFRREFELESEDAVPITEIVLWDQTQKEIIIDRDHWDDEKMFSGICGMVTSRMYDREFLERNNIYFDETVPFAEDYLFNIEAYGHADKICYLPQTIGYHYFINSGSLVQSSEKNAATLIAYAKGYKKLFDTGLKYGFFMNAIMSRLLVVLSRYLATSTVLTYEDRKEIRDILGPYVEMTTYLKPSKVYSEMVVQESYYIPRNVILNIDQWSNMGAQKGLLAGDDIDDQTNQRERLLRNILENNIDTDMGNHYGFSSIYTISGYRSRVPLMSHDDYKPLIDLNTRIGETSIFVDEPITNYTYVVSNSGRIKLLPCTKSFTKDYVKVFANMLKGEHSFLLMESSTRNVKYNDHTSMASISSIMLGSFMDIRDRYTDIKITDGHMDVFEDDPDASMMDRLVRGILDKDITQIYANNTCILTKVINQVKRNLEYLFKELTEGRYTPDEKNKKPKGFAKTQERILEICEIIGQYEKGECKNLYKALWPNLKRIIALGDGEYSFYTDRLKRAYQDIEFVNGPLMFPEVVLGEALPGVNEYRLYKEGAFFEFEPVDAKTLKSTGELVLDDEVEAGQLYRVYVTTKAGLYRYNTEHLIKVTKAEKNDVLFILMNQLKNRVVLKGTVVTTKDAYELVEEIDARFQIGISDFVITEGNNNLILYLELENEKKPDEDTIESIISFADKYLNEFILGYEDLRKRGEIDTIQIKYLYPETSILFREVRSTKLGITLDYTLPQHYIWTPAHKKFFENSVIE